MNGRGAAASRSWRSEPTRRTAILKTQQMTPGAGVNAVRRGAAPDSQRATAPAMRVSLPGRLAMRARYAEPLSSPLNALTSERDAMKSALAWARV